MAKQNTVFISYRRTNTWTAQAVYQYLSANGYDVFFDVESIRTGDWLETILSQIKARAHFIIILTPSAVERFKEPNDVMRLEIETAVDEQRNIIPLIFDGFEFSSVEYALVGKLAVIPKYNGLEIPAKYFKSAMQDFCENKLDIDTNIIIHPSPPELMKQAEIIQQASKAQPPIDPIQIQAEKLYEEGRNLSRNSTYEEAIEKFDQAIKLMPSYTRAYYNRGHVKINQKQYSNAIDDYSKVIDFTPTHARAYYNRGCAKYDLTNYKSAIEDFDTAIGLNPNYVSAYCARGIARAKQKQYHKAIEDFDTAIDLNPNLPLIYYNRGNALADQKEYRIAIRDYSKAIDLKPSYATAYHNRGVTKKNLKDYDGAIRDYEKALELDPNYERAKKKLELAKKMLQ